MATASHIQISSANPGVYHASNPSGFTAADATNVLQDNHDHHHAFFDSGSGLHSNDETRVRSNEPSEADSRLDHTVHHILTLYALGASEKEIQRAYQAHRELQRTPGEPNPDVAEHLQDRSRWTRYFGDFDNYVDFLRFFQAEIDRKGVADTIQQHVFGGDEAADGMLKRLFAGVHCTSPTCAIAG